MLGESGAQLDCLELRRCRCIMPAIAQASFHVDTQVREEFSI